MGIGFTYKCVSGSHETLQHSVLLAQLSDGLQDLVHAGQQLWTSLS